MGDYTHEQAVLDALCSASDRRIGQYQVPDATDDDLALADSTFVNEVHQAILRSEWFAEREKAVRERIAQDIDRDIATVEAWSAESHDQAGQYAAVREGLIRAARIAREGSL